MDNVIARSASQRRSNLNMREIASHKTLAMTVGLMQRAFKGELVG
ncbi:MAG TPA: hypothetical protein VFG32_13405 [Bacteroidota bacterium]|nr:hypothetical protein [Bacteroidota bacterium]